MSLNWYRCLLLLLLSLHGSSKAFAGVPIFLQNHLSPSCSMSRFTLSIHSFLPLLPSWIRLIVTFILSACLLRVAWPYHLVLSLLVQLVTHCTPASSSAAKSTWAARDKTPVKGSFIVSREPPIGDLPIANQHERNKHSECIYC